MRSVKVSLNIHTKSFLENKVALFGGWYLHYRKSNDKAKDLWDKVAIFIIHVLGLLSLLYLKSIAFFIAIIYKLSQGTLRDKLDRWIDEKS